MLEGCPPHRPEIQYVTITRLRPNGSGPRGKVADIVSQPSLQTGGTVQEALTRLTDTYAGLVRAVAVLGQRSHPQLAPMYAAVYSRRFRNYNNCR
jgi:hypothetical protein